MKSEVQLENIYLHASYNGHVCTYNIISFLEENNETLRKVVKLFVNGFKYFTLKT